MIAEESPGDGQAFTARTGADGTYQLLLPRGLYMVLAIHPGDTLGGRPVSLGDSPAREDFTLVPGGAIEIGTPNRRDASSVIRSKAPSRGVSRMS